MYIHKLSKTTSGAGNRMTMGFRGMRGNNKIARHHKRTMGSGLKPEVFEDGKVHRATDTLRNLRLSKPRVPKKYISFNA
jgi:hypothetical protein